jgi:ABC-2 type transport system permease protein
MFAVTNFAMMFIGSIFAAKAQLYEAKDNELLLSMPIPPSAILASRMLTLLLINLAFDLMIAVPAGIAWAQSCRFAQPAFLRFL